MFTSHLYRRAPHREPSYHTSQAAWDSGQDSRVAKEDMELRLLAEELFGRFLDRCQAGEVELQKYGLFPRFFPQGCDGCIGVGPAARREVHFRIVLQEDLRTVKYRRPATAECGKVTLTVSKPLPLLPPRWRKKLRLASDARLTRFRRRTGHDDSPSSQVRYLVDVELRRWRPHLYKDRPACLFPVGDCCTHRVESRR